MSDEIQKQSTLFAEDFPASRTAQPVKDSPARTKETWWGEFARIIREIRPRWVVAENVRGLLSSENGAFFGRVLGDLAASGYDAEWSILRASEFGYPHRRERVIIVAYPDAHGLEKSAGDPVLQQQAQDAQDGGHNRTIRGPIVFRDKPRRSEILPRPESLGMADGFSHRLDNIRLGMMGNAIVPDIAEWIGRRIMAL